MTQYLSNKRLKSRLQAKANRPPAWTKPICPRRRTTSAEPSISLHLLGNDVGCVLRHVFEPDTGQVAPFRSGYTNQDCQAD
jgi:hypothetical protein